MFKGIRLKGKGQFGRHEFCVNSIFTFSICKNCINIAEFKWFFYINWKFWWWSKLWLVLGCPKQCKKSTRKTTKWLKIFDRRLILSNCEYDFSLLLTLVFFNFWFLYIIRIFVCSVLLLEQTSEKKYINWFSRAHTLKRS